MRSSLVAAMLAAAACAQAPVAMLPFANGEVIELGRGYSIGSQVLGEERRLNIYQPPGYADASKRFPVLYLLDGGVEQDFVHIAGLGQHAWISASFAEMIVVGIETKDRRRELAFRATSDAQLAKDYPTHGKSAKFREFIVKEVKPWIRERYRINGHDVLMGESLAGLFVVETFLKAPASFDGYAAIDPSLWWDNEALGKDAERLILTHSAGGQALFMAVANEGADMRAGQDMVANAVRHALPPGTTLTYRVMDDERHSTIYHRAALEAVRVLFPVTE
jgi:predicted alpha/beta superfamily hydrolase